MKKIAFIFISLIMLSACNSNESNEKKTSSKRKNLDRISFVEPPNYSMDQLKNFGIDISKNIPTGLKKGDTVPDFTAIDQDGNPIHLYNILKEKPVVLFFYRGNWCPVCNNYLVQFQGSVRRLVQGGAFIIGVSPETIENTKFTVHSKNLSFSVISDDDYAIIERFKVGYYLTNDYLKKIQDNIHVDLLKHNNDIEARLPVPATFVINKDATIIKSFFNVDQTIRASVDQIEETLH